MNKVIKIAVLVVGCSLMIGTVAFTVLFLSLGYKFNPSASAPVGIWKLNKNKVPEKGDYVFICPPVHELLEDLVDKNLLLPGSCESKTAPFIKTMVGVFGETMDIHADHGVFIDGVLIENTKPYDWPGLEMASARIIRQGEFVALQTAHEASIDSRYFGVLRTSDIISVIEPVWVQE